MDTRKIDRLKAKLDNSAPLPEVLRKNLADWFRVELTYTSNAIEGNTLTRAETAIVLEKGQTVGGKTLTEHLEAVNHGMAIDWIREHASDKLASVSARAILELHAIVLRGIDDANAGRFRSVAVRISGSTVVLPNPRKVPQLVAGFISWLQGASEEHPARIAAEAHYRLVTIHPFVDGNGRTARLVMNWILLMFGYPPAIIQPSERTRYIESLERAQLGGSKSDYEKIIAAAVARSLQVYIEAAESDGADEAAADPMKIGELARRTGLAPSTIRYWTQEGLLEVAGTTPGGYALYSPCAVERIIRILALKEKRYTLREIRTLIEESPQ